MAWNMLLTAAGTILGLAGLGYSLHEPQFDYELAAPSDQSSVVYASDQQSQGVTVSFHDARVADVLSWLEKQGVSFVVADSSIKDREVTLNVVDQPLEKVVDSIAHALNGHWDREGAIRVFRSGDRTPDFFGSLQSPNSGVFTYRPQTGQNEFLYRFDNKGLKGSPNDLKGFTFPKDGNNQFKLFTKPGGNPFVLFGKRDKIDFEAATKSLSPKQKELMKSRGFLKPSDLTVEQRAKLGVTDYSGHFELSYEKGSEKIVIRSD